MSSTFAETAANQQRGLYKIYLQEAQTAYHLCSHQESYSKAYDCECIAGAFFDARVEIGDFKSFDEILQDSLPNCKSAPRIANHHYNQCMSWSAPIRRDPKEFCNCYANSIGRSFAEKTFASPNEEEGVMKLALKECNFRNARNQRRSNEILKEDLYKKGLFERLFPSFGNDE